MLSVAQLAVAVAKHRTFYNGAMVEEGHPAGSSYGKQSQHIPPHIGKILELLYLLLLRRVTSKLFL